MNNKVRIRFIFIYYVFVISCTKVLQIDHIQKKASKCITNNKPYIKEYADNQPVRLNQVSYLYNRNIGRYAD
ncbi:hypothetical protein PRMUPPPA20_27100 [Xylanibacter ruminicola]|uniref:Lipoprotein n=1 Tax=Xylanibacter ruminicola TaxID=839 RepID=A0AA37I3F5_XYLRU|nr:hypothetical protein PRMUPPPA20_27100 [Xylanibacter ruminicola]